MEITDKQIEQLRAEAAQAGDTGMVATCDRALGDVELELCRCDLGSGGWSLHLDDEDESLISSGDAEMVTDSSGFEDWNRPNAEDYAAAREQVVAAARAECTSMITK